MYNTCSYKEKKHRNIDILDNVFYERIKINENVSGIIRLSPVVKFIQNRIFLLFTFKLKLFIKLHL